MFFCSFPFRSLPCDLAPPPLPLTQVLMRLNILDKLFNRATQNAKKSLNQRLIVCWSDFGDNIQQSFGNKHVS